MKTMLEYKMIDAVFKAKLLLESRHQRESELKWSYAATLNVRNNEENRVKLYVLEGPKPKGYIIASYSAKVVKVFDENMMHLITYEVEEGIFP